MNPIGCPDRAQPELYRRAASFLCAILLAAAFALPVTAQTSERPRAKTDVIALDGAVLPAGIVATDGAEPMVWFAATQRGAIGEMEQGGKAVGYIALGHGAKPRGLARCPNGKLYALDPTLNVIHEVTPSTEEVKRHPVPGGQIVDLSGVTCTAGNVLIFTGYNGWIGKLDTATGSVSLVEALGGRGAAQIAIAPSGSVWFASYATNQIIRLDAVSMKQDAFAMPAGVEGPKGIVIDGSGRVWVSAFRSTRIARFDPRRRSWDAWSLGEGSRPHALALDDNGGILVTDVGRDRLMRFDASTGSHAIVAPLSERGQARAMTRVASKVWITETAVDRVTVVDMAEQAASN